MDERLMTIWEFIFDRNIATNEELGLAVALCGMSEQTLNSVLMIRTGYRSIEQILEEEEENW